MRKVLVLGGYRPFEYHTIEDFLTHSQMMGGNIGNILFINAAVQSLNDGDTEFVPAFYRNRFTQRMIDMINSEFDCFILPLADAFRDDAVGWLGRLADVITKLKIPCLVTSVGLRAPFDANLSDKRIIDETAKRFIAAILDKSALVGVRGEITGKYLSHLGFIEDKHYMVTGCPSLSALRPQDLKISLTTTDTKQSTLGINMNTLQPRYVSNFAVRSLSEFRDYFIIQQKEQEFADVFLSKYCEMNLRRRDFPSSIYGQALFSKMLNENRVKVFSDIYDCVEFFNKDIDLSLSTRFHGSVFSVVAGVPTVTIPLDSRMHELTEYHNLTKISLSELQEENCTLSSLLQKLDFQAPERVAERNFERWICFLKKNGIESKLPAISLYKQDKKRRDETSYTFRELSALQKIGRITRYVIQKPIYVARRRLFFES